MVLAKLPDAPAGVKGISLFIVPKFLVNDDGSLGERNDVLLAGLFHKMGWRGTTSTALNFGDNGQCVGYLVGKPHQGLSYMFQMMNEARIGVGMGAVMLGYAGYLYSLEYARERPAACRTAKTRHRAGGDHPARRRQAHAADAKGLRRRRLRPWPVRRAAVRRHHDPGDRRPSGRPTNCSTC
jgi:alkylation response protein AidB-like acyl-CoA dehydrogenase